MRRSASAMNPARSPSPSRIDEWLAAAAALLAPMYTAARLETEVLLAHVLQRSRSHLRAFPERTLGPDEVNGFLDLVERRRRGEPIAYLTGMREFWSLPLRVTPDTLIPRPETEHLVELALEHLPGDDAAWVADLGTGAGPLALALAHERPAAHVVATDTSAAALEVARGNAARLGLGNVEFRRGDWCRALGPDERYAVIVSNPPYVPAGDPHLGRGDVRFEPWRALAAGPDGLDAIRRIAFAARHALAPGGWLLLEHGYDQAPAVRRLLMRYGYRAITTHEDLAAHPRVTQAQGAGSP